MKPYNIIIIIIIGLAGIIVIKSNSLPISDQNTSQTPVVDFPQQRVDEKTKRNRSAIAKLIANTRKVL